MSQYLLISAEANLCDTGSAADPHSLGLQDALVAAISFGAMAVSGCVLILWDVYTHRYPYQQNLGVMEVHVVFTQK